MICRLEAPKVSAKAASKPLAVTLNMEMLATLSQGIIRKLWAISSSLRVGLGLSLKEAGYLYKEHTPIPDILKTVKISKSTLYSYVRNDTRL